MPDTAQRIEAIVDVAIRDLFAHYQIALTELADGVPPTTNLVYCGVIGFTGDDLRGTMMLAASREPLAAVESSESAMRDWLGEMTNQLLGRIKNQLIAIGAVIHGSTPVLLRGEYIAPLASRPPRAHVFTSAAGGYVSVWFDAEARPGLELAAVPDDRATVFEGESLMF